MKKKLQNVIFAGKSFKIVLLMIFGVSLALQLNATSLAANQKRISLRLKDGSIKELFAEIRKQTDVNFVYNDEQMSKLPLITIQVINESVNNILNAVLKNTPYTYTVQGNSFAIVARKVDATSTPQTKPIQINGTVVDNKGRPIAGAAVSVKGTSVGTTTNADGKFSIMAREHQILVFSFLGMETLEQKVTAKTGLKIVMVESASSIDNIEVISNGYYDVDKRLSTSAVTSLKADDIKVAGMSTIDQMLEGHVPGMIFMQNSGQVGAAPKVKIRGTTTLLGSQSPLWVVDGVILTEPVNVDPQQINDYDFVNLLGNAISGLNPEDVEQIDVLKDASATAIYGPQAANGVIVITTKKGKSGPPSVSYSVSGTFRQRPRYTDRSINVMNSMERVDYSREIIEKKLFMEKLGSHVGYEAATQDLYNRVISYDEFEKRVARMETVNTDWFGILLKDALSHNHTLSLSGGDESIRYYTSLGYNSENGNIKGEENNRYSARINVNANYKKFDLGVTMSGNIQDRQYAPKEIDVMNYAYNTSRALEAFDDKGDLWYYQRGNEHLYVTPFSILNEQANSSNDIKTSQVDFSVNAGYRFIPQLRLSVQLAYSLSNTSDYTHFQEDT